MAGTKEIKRRIKSIGNTKKITKAMELVSASKMKKAVSQTLSSRLYATYSWGILTSLSRNLEDVTHPFFTIKEKGKSNIDLIVLISSNRGLCGGYNSQVIKKVIEMLKSSNTGSLVNFEIITVGKKGDSAMRKIGEKVVASFLEFPDTNISPSDINPLSTLITKDFGVGKYDNVYITYTDFVSALSQKPKLRRILPISKDDVKNMIEDMAGENIDIKESKEENQSPHLFEGDTEKLLGMLAEKIVRMQIYQMILESNASEQSSRMVAMKNANEAAEEMISDLTLVFNKARQAGITREISEISAGMAAAS